MTWTRHFMLMALAAAVALALAAVPRPAAAADTQVESRVDASKLSKNKRTSLGLYVTAEEAAEALKQDPDALLIDIRARGEVMFVGQATPSAKNIPYSEFGPYAFDAKKGAYKMVANPQFADAVEELVVKKGGDKETTIIMMCRSGSRSAAAADLMAKRGYKNVYTMVDGFEGDMDKKTGRRSLNGWKNADLPWTYKFEKDEIYESPGR